MKRVGATAFLRYRGSSPTCLREHEKGSAFAPQGLGPW